MKISVIIPAYNRVEYLYFTLLSCEKQNYQNVEFIIQDDCSTDGTEEMVRSFVKRDSRFIYRNIGINVGMRQNFENALNAASGSYLICLGSDDGLMPNSLIEITEELLVSKAQVLTWPAPMFAYRSIVYDEETLLAPHLIFGKRQLRKVLGQTFIKQEIEKLHYVNNYFAPMLYVKSIVSMDIVNKIRSMSGGQFYNCTTPDGYSAFAISSVTDYFFSNQPYTIFGSSPSSQGLLYRVNNTNEQVSKFFEESSNSPMAKELGSIDYSPLIAMMTADFIFKTDHLFHHGLSTTVDYKKIISSALNELCSAYSREVILRELKLIEKTSLINNLNSYFHEELKTKFLNNRQFLARSPLITLRYLSFPVKKMNIVNILSAGEYIYNQKNRTNIYQHALNPSLLLNTLKTLLENKTNSQTSLAEIYYKNV